MSDPDFDTEDPMFPEVFGEASDPALRALEADPVSLDEAVSVLAQIRMPTIEPGVDMDIAEPMPFADQAALPPGPAQLVTNDMDAALREVEAAGGITLPEGAEAVADVPASGGFSQGPGAPTPPPIPLSPEERAAARRQGIEERNRMTGQAAVSPGQEPRLGAASIYRTPNGQLAQVSPSAIPRRQARNLSGAMLESTIDIPGAVSPETQALLVDATQRAQVARAAAVAAEVQGLEDQADLLDDMADDILTSAVELQEASREAKAETDQAISRLQEITNAIGEARIDPNRLFNTGPASNRFAAAIAIAAGTMAQNLNPGTQNTALQIVQSAVDRDLQAQVADIQRLGLQANNQRSVLAALRQAYQDDVAALEAYRALRLSHAATQMRSVAFRNQGTQASVNFAAAEAELRRQAIAAQAEAERNLFRYTLTTKLAMPGVAGIRRGEAFARQRLGMSEPTSQPRRSGGRAGGSRTQGEQPPSFGRLVADVLGGRATVDQQTARAMMEHLNAQGGAFTILQSETNRDEWVVAPIEGLDLVSLEEVENVQEDAGLRFDALNVIMTSGERDALFANFGEEEAPKIIAGLGDLAALRNTLQSFEDMDGRIGWSVFSEESAEAEAMAASLWTQLAQAQGLGALAGPDLDLIQLQAQSPLSLFNPNATARLRGTIRSVENRLKEQLRIVGVDISNFGEVSSLAAAGSAKAPIEAPADE